MRSGLRSKFKAKIIAAFACAGFLFSSAYADERPVVAVPGGQILGKTIDGSHVFQGIPFAAPPIGKLRWQPPQPVVPWQGVRDAEYAGPACLQNEEGWNRADWLRASEDCLTLNVRTPSLTGKRPVIVWIHGGSNRAGSSYGAIQSGFVKHGLVVVSLQYRLGLLGFLSHPALSAEQGGHSGNYGLMDQVAGLKWVRDNIARFGGDPDRVTIFGESAGSQDVSLMLATPSARGLFKGAIMQSGTPGFGMSFRPLADAEKLGTQFGDLVGTQDIHQLRAMSPLAMFALQKNVQEPESRGNDFLFLRITIDGRVLPDAPDKLIAARPPMPVIIGTDAIEFGPNKGGVQLSEFSQYWFGNNAAKALAAYQAEEAAGPDPRRGHLELRMHSDAQFHCPANRLAQLMVSKGWPVWQYEFDVGPNGGLTSHAYEVGFVFEGKAVGGGVKMQDYWAALAITGSADGPLATSGPRPAWPKLNSRSPSYLRFAANETKLAKGQPRIGYCGWSSNF